MSTITTTQIFQGVPLQKLQGLIDAGWEINGVSIQRSEEGKTRHGALTLGGMVLWWNQEQPALQEPSQQDIPDILAGALGVSRGTAYDMMREALAEPQDPVGYLYEGIEYHTKGTRQFSEKQVRNLEARWWRFVGPVYTAPQPQPPQCQPLTIKTADAILGKTDVWASLVQKHTKKGVCNFQDAADELAATVYINIKNNSITEGGAA